MSEITIRPARSEDLLQMVTLLNEIIEVGGTTAYLTPISEHALEEKMARGGAKASWLVATEGDQVLGFQWAEPHVDLPPEAASIATFVRIGTVGKGIGSKLFAATCAAMKDKGFRWLNASIRSDNESGLTYYTKMGFTDWKVEPDAALSDGRITGKHHKRFEL